MKTKFKYGGYTGKILDVDLSKGKTAAIPLRPDLCRAFLGGRGLAAQLMYDHLPPDAAPLSPDNIVIFSTGPLNGLIGPTTGRMNIAARSPLTGIYGNTNVGSNLSVGLKYAGFDAVVIRGAAAEPCTLHIRDGAAEILPARDLWGKGVFETTALLRERHGEETNVAAVGPAAERGVLFGGVIFDYWDAAARTGMGTVLASKKLKAVSVDGTGALVVSRPERYMEAAREAWQAILGDPGFRTGEHSGLGTAVCVNWGNGQGWLPTRNFRESVFEGADAISGEEFRDRYSTKPAPIPAGRACFSCPNRCKRFGFVEEGPYAGTRGNIEFEGIAAFGSKCGVDRLDAVFHAYMLANDYGMDCISCGNTIALFMELRQEGLLSGEETDGLDLRFGNHEAMVEMVHRIGTGEGKLGRLGGLGSLRAAREIGKGAEERTTTVKGMETIACDPRGAKGFGFGYAVASRGSDHLRAHPVFEMLRMPPEVAAKLFGSPEAAHLRKYGGKAAMIFWHENMGAVTDSLGSCRFMQASYYAEYPVPELLAEASGFKGEVHSIKYHDLLSAAAGFDITYDDLLRAGDRILNIERALNVRWGIRRKDDTLPKRFLKEPLPSGPAKGEVFDEAALQKMLDEYYALRGWDADGLQRPEKLAALGLDDVAADLKKRRLLGEG